LHFYSRLGARQSFFITNSPFDHPLNKAENWHFASATQPYFGRLATSRKNTPLSQQKEFFFTLAGLGRTPKVARKAEMEACPLSIRANLWRRMNSPIDQCVPPLSGGRVLLLFIGFNANIHHRPRRAGSVCSRGQISAISQQQEQTVPRH
jgi:hypothetical protein